VYKGNNKITEQSSKGKGKTHNRVASKTAFATVKSTIDTSNSSNTVLLFLKYTNRQNRSITGKLWKP